MILFQIIKIKTKKKRRRRKIEKKRKSEISRSFRIYFYHLGAYRLILTSISLKKHRNLHSVVPVKEKNDRIEEKQKIFFFLFFFDNFLLKNKMK